MASLRTSIPNRAYLFLLLSTLLCLVAAIDVEICSSFNTADMPKNVSVYQTNGLCEGFCRSKSAFAVTQGNGCWCTDFFPDEGSRVDTKKCDFPCPAYPLEDCGGTGLFGYFALNQIAPSGTKTASAPSTSTTSQDSSSSSSSSAVRTVTDSGGAVRTVTVVPSAAPDDNNHGSVPVKSSKLGTGAIVGIAVGVVGAALIVLGGLLFWFLKRKKRNQNDYQDDPSVRGSSSGMIASTLPEMSMNGETSASPGSVGNRNSAIQIDPRMDPFKQGVYLRSASHESLNTLRDEHDYSRRIQPPKVLRATNPDPQPEES
ncbi:hypothetical protein PT974_09635 [Cladobotryum mycophilum]|uniref:WSC domain-containing protein n=1 Tax=Cladobotryum mycophilum TaxID=491253 RepID=A0ABR0SH80_9HYPO